MIARAETDYTCLGACVNSGSPSYRCIEKCSFGANASGVMGAPKADGACLDGCMKGGGNPQACLPQCTHLSAQAPAASHIATKPATSRNLFKPLLPAPDSPVLTAPHASQPPENRDYRCMDLCVQGHMRYALCEERCTK